MTVAAGAVQAKDAVEHVSERAETATHAWTANAAT
jgi:hypothetical protein